MIWRRLTGLSIAALIAALLPGCGGNPGGPGPVVNAPIVHSITPATGASSGGTAVTIRGLYFIAGATVVIGGRPAGNVVVQSADVITATTPAASGSGAVEVGVTTSAGSGILAGGFTYGAPPVNAPPLIASITAQGSRARQPANFADLGEIITVSANVTDLETPTGQLEYHWTATAGAFSGNGASVTWQAPAVSATPVTVGLVLRVVERYGPSGTLQHEVSRTRTLSLHDSTREVGSMARRFLTEFSRPQTNQNWRDVMLDFDLDRNVCPNPGLVDDEREDVEFHYRNFVMHAYDIGAASVAVNFGGACPIPGRVNRPGDACVTVPVFWDSTDKRDNVRRQTRGTDYLAAVYSSDQARWRLCSSDLPGSSQTLSGHTIYTR